MTEFRWLHPLEEFEGDRLRAYLKDCGMTGADLAQVLGVSKPTANDRIKRPETVSADELSAIIDAIRSKACGDAVACGVFASIEDAQRHYDSIQDHVQEQTREAIALRKRLLSLKPDDAGSLFALRAETACKITRLAWAYSEDRYMTDYEDKVRDIVHIIERMDDEELEKLHRQLSERFPDYLSDCEAV